MGGFFLLLFFICLLLQHYDRRGQYDIALGKIEEAINHTPTVIDLYSVKVCTAYCTAIPDSLFLISNVGVCPVSLIHPLSISPLLLGGIRHVLLKSPVSFV